MKINIAHNIEVTRENKHPQANPLWMCPESLSHNNKIDDELLFIKIHLLIKMVQNIVRR